MIYFGFDKDGTLELPEFPVPEKLITLLKHLLSLEQVTTFISSGRSIGQLQEFCQNIDFTPAIISGENGGHFLFTDTQKEIILDDVSSDLKFFKANFKGSVPQIHIEPRMAAWTSFFGERVGDAYEEISSFILKHRLNLRCYVHQGSDGSIDVVSPLINKMNILNYLPNNSEVFYFGDNVNDVEIMNSSNVIPCTFNNASNEVQQIVKNRSGYYSDKIAGDGVFEILNLILDQHNLNQK